MTLTLVVATAIVLVWVGYLRWEEKKGAKAMVKLSKWEVDLLPLSLITPRDWAEQIKRRNEGLFDALVREDWDYEGGFGCPHCLEKKDSCGYCRWGVLSQGGCDGGRFDGLRLGDMSIVGYCPNSEDLDSDILVKSYGIDEEKIMDESRRFLEAHILWADRMIDGTYVAYAEHHGIKTPVCGNDGIWRKA